MPVVEVEIILVNVNSPLSELYVQLIEETILLESPVQVGFVVII